MRRLRVVAALIGVALVGASASSPTPAATPLGAATSSSGQGGWKRTELAEGAWPNGINERGQIVGQTQTGEAVLWENGRQRVLKVPGDSYLLRANAINDAGLIVGGGALRGSEHAILWRDGVAQALPFTNAVDINNRGQVVGRRDGAAVVWVSSRLRMLPGVACRGLAINDRGVVVGACGGSQAVLWKQGRIRKLLGSSSEAVDINNRGQVVGWSRTARGKPRHGFLWRNGKLIDLGAGFVPSAINDRGEMVGACRASTRVGPSACVWESGRITKLFDPERQDSEATAISERRQIAGHWSDSCGPDCMVIERAYLWSPRG